jgi:hypothetical protein
MIEFFTLKPASGIEVFLFILSFIIIIFFVTIGIRIIRKLIYPTGEEEKVAIIKDKCEKRGLTSEETNLLLNIFKKEKIENGLAYFENFDLMKDLIIKYITYYSAKTKDKDELITLKNRLYNILNSVANVYKKRKLTNTYSIKEGTKLIVQFKDKFFNSKLLMNTEDYLVIERVPLLEENSLDNYEHFKITIFFFNPDDAGYSFETNIIRDIKSKNVEALIVEHSENLRRHQKRRFIRKDCNISCVINLIEKQFIDGKEKEFISNKKIDGIIKNISINGLEIHLYEEKDLNAFMNLKRILLRFKINNEEIKLFANIVNIENGNIHLKTIKILNNKDYLINDFIYLY